MDTYEATKIVMSRVQNLDPENASKIMGYILIQEQGEKEIIRLAFSPEAVLASYINQAKAGLGLLSNSPPSKSSTPLPYPVRPDIPFPKNSPRIMVPNNGILLSNPSSPAAPFQRSGAKPISYADAVDGAITNNNAGSGSGSPILGSHSGNDFGDGYFNGGMRHQNQDQLPFHDDAVVDPIMSPSGRSDSLLFPFVEDVNGIPSPQPHPFHRRNCSVNDAAFLPNFEEGGGGNGFLWRPCIYYARGFCKNGSSCKFLHSDVGGFEAVETGSPSNSSGFDELLRARVLQRQSFAPMASAGHHPFAYNNHLNENLRNELSPFGLGAGASSSSRQIYLTFPADSTFKEEDVSSYFRIFGPVEDVRIPYQQKRMFGFVTFVYPETVKLILAKGNPHFVCDSRVLVKPYKEKAKVREKKQQQQQQQLHLARGEYSSCLSPPGVDVRELVHQPLGSRVLLSPEEMILRRKLGQQAELQHAIELQGRRMMNLPLMDIKNRNQNHDFLQNMLPYSSLRLSQLLLKQHVASADSVNQDDSEEFDGGQKSGTSPTVASDGTLVPDGTESSTINNINVGNQLHYVNAEDPDVPESLDRILPDNLFASPTKRDAQQQPVFSQGSAEVVATAPATIAPANNDTVPTSTSPLTTASLKSFFPSNASSSGKEATEM